MLYNFLNKTPRNEEIACKQFGEQAVWHTEDYFRNPQEKQTKTTIHTIKDFMQDITFIQIED